jgi:hypothetical protein
MATITLLTRPELAALLRVSTRTLDRQRSEGLVLDPLPGHGRPRWNADEVAAWVQAGRPSAAAWRQLRIRRR